MAAGDGPLERRSSLAPTWSKLADHVLAMIRLKVSLRDCVRMAAVCRSWRSLASDPVIPLLLLSPHCCEARKRVYCPEDGGFLDVEALSAARCGSPLGTHDGGWIAVGGYIMLTVVNVFSGVEVKIPVNPGQEFGISGKIIFSEVPTSSGCVLAAITGDRFNIALYRASRRDGLWTMTPGLGLVELADIAFCSGELYGLYDDKYEKSSFAIRETTSLRLFKFDIGVNKCGAPVVTAGLQLAELLVPSRIREKARCSYMVEMHGKPSIAVVAQWQPGQELFFKVFELADSDDGGLRWAEVTSLGGYALFVSPMCSRAVEVGDHMQGNAVYHSSDRRCSGGSGKVLAGDREGVQSIGYCTGKGPSHSMWLCRPAELLISDLRARFM